MLLVCLLFINLKGNNVYTMFVIRIRKKKQIKKCPIKKGQIDKNKKFKMWFCCLRGLRVKKLEIFSVCLLIFVLYNLIKIKHFNITRNGELSLQLNLRKYEIRRIIDPSTNDENKSLEETTSTRDREIIFIKPN